MANVPRPLLVGSQLKLRRAHDHLSFLDAEVGVFLGDKDRSPLTYFDRARSEYVFGLTGDPPPLEWGIRVGEFAHNLRSALDNLLWQLVLLRGATPGGVTQFPIYDDRSRYTTKAGAMIQGVSTNDSAFIERAQPYHLGGKLATRHPLALLGYLNNADKHRFLHAAYTSMIVSDAWPVDLPRLPFYSEALDIIADHGTGEIKGLPFFVPNTDAQVTYINYGPDDRTELVRVGIKAIGPDPQVEMQNPLEVTVSLSDRERPMGIEHLNEIGATVQKILDRFAPDFA